MSIAGWIGIIFATIVAVALIIVLPLARIFLKSRYKITSSSDRGIKKFRDASGVGILFVPALKIRKYINQYILYEKGTQSYLYAKIRDDIQYIDFDIVAFDDENKIIKVLAVKELIEKKGTTSVIALPEGTSYVSLILNQVNNDKIEKDEHSGIELKMLIPFCVISSILIIAECFIIKYCLSQMVGGLYAELFNSSIGSIFITIGIGLGLSAIATAALIIGLKLKERKG